MDYYEPDFPPMSGAPSRRRDRAVAFLSLVSASVLIFGYLWWGRFEYSSKAYLAFTYLGLGALIFFNHFYFGEGPSVLGLRVDNLPRSLAYTLPLTGLLSLPIFAKGFAQDTFHRGRWQEIFIYFGWALLQQYGLQNFLFSRCRNLFQRTPLAVLAASALFAVYHLPNLPLMTLTLVGALFWCWIFHRIPNLLGVSLSHGVLAVLVVLFFKFDGINQFQIGKPGYRYQAYGGGVLVAAGYDHSNRAFIVTLPGHDQRVVSRLRIYRLDGQLVREWTAFPEYSFSGRVAVGDLGFGPGDEIAVTPGPASQNPPLVRIFSLDGKLLSEFQTEPQDGYGAGISVGEKTLYITPGPAPGQAAEVLEYSPSGRLARRHSLKQLEFQNGIQSAPYDGLDLLVLWGAPISVNPSKFLVYDPKHGSFRERDPFRVTYGLNLTTINLGDHGIGLLTAPGPLRGYFPHLKIFDSHGSELYNFFAYVDPSACGSNVAAVDVDGDGKDEIVLGEGICKDRRPAVRILNLSGKLLYQWDAY